MKHSHFAVAALALALTLGAATAHAEDRSGIDDAPSPLAMGLDLLFVRPLSLVATGIGCAIFVVNVPFALMRGESPKSIPLEDFGQTSLIVNLDAARALNIQLPPALVRSAKSVIGEPVGNR